MYWCYPILSYTGKSKNLYPPFAYHPNQNVVSIMKSKVAVKICLMIPQIWQHNLIHYWNPLNKLFYTNNEINSVYVSC